MMIRKKNKNEVPALDTTSTADISFMLLIFFLVTTSMDIDKGLLRQLPPADNTEQEAETDIEKDNLLAFRIDADSRLYCNDQPTDTKNLRSSIQQFIKEKGKQHLITIDAHPSARYDTYFHLQDEIVAAYNTLRDQLATRQYGQAYANLSEEEKDNIRKQLPQRIAEQYNMDENGAATGIQTVNKSKNKTEKGGDQE